MGQIHVKKLIHQKGYEKIERIIRRDKIILIGHLLYFVLLLAVPIVLYFLFRSYLPMILAHNVWYPVLVIGVSIYYFSTWIFSSLSIPWC